MASILAVQALFFADGGLLALGANIFNLGFFPAFVAYPLVYRRIVGDGQLARRRVIVGGRARRRSSACSSAPSPWCSRRRRRA